MKHLKTIYIIIWYYSKQGRRHYEYISHGKIASGAGIKAA